MKAIAFAILCGAYLLVPTAEAKAMPSWLLNIHGVVNILCIVGFWFSITTEE